MFIGTGYLFPMYILFKAKRYIRQFGKISKSEDSDSDLRIEKLAANHIPRDC